MHLTYFLVAEKCGSNFKSAIYKQVLQINILNSSFEIALGKVPQNPVNDASKLI